MSDGDKPRIGVPVIHISPVEPDDKFNTEESTDSARGRFGFRDTTKHDSSPVARRKSRGSSQAGRDSRRVTIIDGRPTSQPGMDTLKSIEDEDSYLSSGESDMELADLPVKDIKVLEKAMEADLDEEAVFTVPQILSFAKQLKKDIRGFEKIASSIQKNLATRPYVDKEVKKTILQQCEKVQTYCGELQNKLSLVKEAAKRHDETVLALKEGAGISYSHKDLRRLKKTEDAKTTDTVTSAEIICDGYKYLLDMSRLWKMEWPSFDLLTGMAADFAGVTITDADTKISPPPPKGVDPRQWQNLIAIERRMEELNHLGSQLKVMMSRASNPEEPGLRELLGTIYPDAESQLKPMPMDYFYQLGGTAALHGKPLDMFGKRLERMLNDVSKVQQQKEFLQKLLVQGKSHEVNDQGEDVDISKELEKLVNSYQQVEKHWTASLPSVQRMYTEGPRKKAKHHR